MYKSTIILLIVALFFSCNKENVNKRNLKGCWVHSYEESEETYRPCDYMDFPSSRFRFKFKLKDSNECEFLNLAPNDAHYMSDGTWKIDKESHILEINNVKYKVVKIESDLLILEKL